MYMLGLKQYVKPIFVWKTFYKHTLYINWIRLLHMILFQLLFRGETHVESLGDGEGGDVTSSLLSIDVDAPELPGKFRKH